ncbi:hypothetical protein EYF80_011610 [Liparis tanakae]|uniref:Uncharacterized protein n=1 Tax=Liparis tanakae TaxID=230148 RepID=A0A4Z2IJX4_9TELE|nr:hypothetical protein EYF80_011610 [Liparis tanakae]
MFAFVCEYKSDRSNEMLLVEVGNPSPAGAMFKATAHVPLADSKRLFPCGRGDRVASPPGPLRPEHQPNEAVVSDEDHPCHFFISLAGVWSLQTERQTPYSISGDGAHRSWTGPTSSHTRARLGL